MTSFQSFFNEQTLAQHEKMTIFCTKSKVKGAVPSLPPNESLGLTEVQNYKNLAEKFPQLEKLIFLDLFLAIQTFIPW